LTKRGHNIRSASTWEQFKHRAGCLSARMAGGASETLVWRRTLQICLLLLGAVHHL